MIKVKIAKNHETYKNWVEVELPITSDNWKEKLLAIGSTGEYIIVDATSDNEFASYMIRETFPTVQELNYIAVAMMDAWSPEIASMYMLETNLHANWAEFINALYQSEDIPYYTYDEPPETNLYGCNENEKFGYHQAYSRGLWDKLCEFYAEDYFDFEEYGRNESVNCDVILFDNGYIDLGANEIDLEYYTPEEIEDDYENYYLGNVVIEDTELAERVFDLLAG